MKANWVAFDDYCGYEIFFSSIGFLASSIV